MDVRTVVFNQHGKPSLQLLKAWKRQGAGQGLPPRLQCVHGDGRATREFRGLFRAAFPNAAAIPLDPIAGKDGRFTDLMRGIFIAAY